MEVEGFMWWDCIFRYGFFFGLMNKDFCSSFLIYNYFVIYLIVFLVVFYLGNGKREEERGGRE